jgi:hypothetical protein
MLCLALAILREGLAYVNNVHETTLLVPPHEPFVGASIDQFTLPACQTQLRA